MKLLLTISTFFWAISIYAQVVNPFDIPKTQSEVTSMPLVEDLGQSLSAITDSLAPVGAIKVAGTDTASLASDAIFENPSIRSNDNPFEIGGTSSTVRNPIDIPLMPVESGDTTSLTENVSGPSNIKILILVYSLAMLVILTLAISLDRKRFGSLLKSCINSNNLKTLYRENKSWENGQSIILYTFFFFNLAFVIWLIALKTNTSAFSNLFFVGAFVILCYAVRHLVMWSISVIYPVGAEVSVHNFSISVHNMILGILLLPIIMAIEFMPGISVSVWIYFSLIIIAIIYILRQAKGFLSCITMRGFNPFYFFIYLCAVEIAPFLVGYKMMVGAL